MSFILRKFGIFKKEKSLIKKMKKSGSWLEIAGKPRVKGIVREK